MIIYNRLSYRGLSPGELGIDTLTTTDLQHSYQGQQRRRPLR